MSKYITTSTAVVFPLTLERFLDHQGDCTKCPVSEFSSNFIELCKDSIGFINAAYWKGRNGLDPDDSIDFDDELQAMYDGMCEASRHYIKAMMQWQRIAYEAGKSTLRSP